jgi:hypothetical protein
LDVNGAIPEGTEDLLSHANFYYKDLFGPALEICSIYPSIYGGWNETLYHDDNHDLIAILLGHSLLRM